MGIRSNLGNINDQFYQKYFLMKQEKTGKKMGTAEDGIDDLWDKVNSVEYFKS